MGSVVLLTASQESRFGRRAAECVVAVRALRLGGGCFKYVFFKLHSIVKNSTVLYSAVSSMNYSISYRV